MIAASPDSAPAHHGGAPAALLDGAIAGTVGGVVFLLWGLGVDLVERRDPLGFAWVPAAVIDRVVLATARVLSPAEAAIAGALLVIPACAAIGALVTWLLTLTRRAPTWGVTLTASFAALQLAFFAFDGATGGGLFGRMRPWSVLAANALAACAITLILLLRQPRLSEGRRDLWDDEP